MYNISVITIQNNIYEIKISFLQNDFQTAYGSYKKEIIHNA